ncbi:MAG: hypothetical protein EZS28_021624, partial [Streblomastix strix]
TVVLLGAGGTKPISEFGGGNDEELSMSEDEEDYLTRGEIYNAFVSRYDNQTIYGTKTINSNVNAAGFAKTSKDDTSVLLAGGGDALISSFGGLFDTAGLSDFPELSAYIQERYPKPIGALSQPALIGKQTL